MVIVARIVGIELTAIIVRALLQLPRLALAHALFEIGVEASATHVGVGLNAGDFIFQTVVAIAQAVFHPRCVDVVRRLAAS